METDRRTGRDPDEPVEPARPGAARPGGHRASWGTHGNPGGLLYGALVAGAVLAVSSANSDDAVTVALAAIQVEIVYWAAHVYTRVLADRLADPSAGLRERAKESLTHELAVLEGGVPAVGTFVVATLAGVSTGRAADLSLLVTVGFLGSAGYVVGRASGARGWALAGEVAVAALLGLLVVGLKAGLH